MHLPNLGEVHDQYLALARLARKGDGVDSAPGKLLGGKLLLRIGFDAEGISVLIAAALTGAAALCVDPEPELLREGLRHGLSDFLVADLSEALRILKNEIRQRRPVLVCVAAHPQAMLPELTERGVQPDFLSLPPSEALPAAAFIQRSAVFVPAPWADPGTTHVEWSVEAEAPRTLPGLAKIAASALDPQRADTPARQHWLASAPRWLGRSWAGDQCLRMTSAEAEAFVQQARAEFQDLPFIRNPLQQ